MKPRNLAKQTMKRAAWIKLADELDANGITPEDVRRTMFGNERGKPGDASAAKRKLAEILARHARSSDDEQE